MEPDTLFKGLADPTRLRIAMLLLETELCVCDIMAVLRMPQSTVSRHMSRMKSTGIVVDRREGKWVHYRLTESQAVTEMRSLLRRNIAHLEPYCSDRILLKKLIRSGGCAGLSKSEPKQASTKQA